MCEIQSFGYGFPLMRTEALYLFDDEVHISETTGIQALNMNKYS